MEFVLWNKIKSHWRSKGYVTTLGYKNIRSASTKCCGITDMNHLDFKLSLLLYLL